MLRWIVAVWLLWAERAAGQALRYSSYLDPERRFHLAWDYNATHIQLEYTAATRGWLALGISPNGGMNQSDVIFAWIDDTTGLPHVQDRWIDVGSSGVNPTLDDKQDWTLVSGKQNTTHSIVRVARLLTTCDPRDRPFTNDTMRIIFAANPRDPAGEAAMIEQHSMRGTKSVVFFTDAFLTERAASILGGGSLLQMDVRVDNVPIPTGIDTSYHCKLIKLPEVNKKYHIIGVRPLIQRGNEHIVHHVVVYYCDSTVNDTVTPKEFECAGDNVDEEAMMNIAVHCHSNVLAVWAIGGSDMYFPPEAGLPLTPEMSDRFVMVEIHYDLSMRTDQADVQDSSGMSFILTEQLRPNDAAVLSTGTMDFNFLITIPPNVDDFVVSSYCHTQCTSMFPADGINIFQSFLHAHTHGRKIILRHIRDGKELPPIGKDDAYDFNYQESRNVQPYRTILPGDTLKLECTFSTAGMSKPAYGGFSSHDEMCLAYLTYYPATPLASCGTNVNFTNYYTTINYTLPAEYSLTDYRSIQIATKDFLNSQMQWDTTSVQTLQGFYNGDTSSECVTIDLNRTAIPTPPLEYTPYDDPATRMCPNLTPNQPSQRLQAEPPRKPAPTAANSTQHSVASITTAGGNLVSVIVILLLCVCQRI
ncbi:DBH-like monooxygenase protein 1 homolog [Paramacrobiotus metropolitanus]|uniref:DBH-like monooxygenase protein 1 homolog n=1 Tax=Paramacrobiotus metropolitanus TaxID=2943436 RepID=UPI0024462412|nr:DBH-like monooxygenase protein 1 homolog [Paramacrobiotus metropolitanus]